MTGRGTIILLGAMAAGAALAVLPNDRTTPAHATGFVREPSLDRSGNDIARKLLPASADVGACEALCTSTPGCRAYTFVKRSTTVPEPICWLKDTVPIGYPSSCCTSGVRK